MTSEGTRNHDMGFKKTLSEQLGVLEYWLFDPKGEWIQEKLQGYRLRGETYEGITDGRCEPLQLRLQVDGQLIISCPVKDLSLRSQGGRGQGAGGREQGESGFSDFCIDA